MMGTIIIMRVRIGIYFLLIAIICLVQNAGFGEERFILRSFSNWEAKTGELSPLFMEIQNPMPDWKKVHTLALNLSREGADDSLKVNLAKYFVILSERALKLNLEKSAVPGKIIELNKINANVNHNKESDFKEFGKDVSQTIAFEIACHKHFLKKDEDAIKDLSLFLKKNPLSIVAPDAAKEIAELFLERKDYNRGISFLQTVARKSRKNSPLHFEAMYQSSILETMLVKKSPRAMWYCQEAVKGVTDELLIQRGKSRLDDLEKMQKEKN